MTKQPDLNLYIEELYLQGVRGNPAQLRSAVEQELARLLTEQGTPLLLRQGYNSAKLDNHHLTMKPGRVESIAAQVAQQIYIGLSGNS